MNPAKVPLDGIYLLSILIVYPAMKPPAIPAKNPPLIIFAATPAANPGPSAGLSEIEYAI